MPAFSKLKHMMDDNTDATHSSTESPQQGQRVQQLLARIQALEQQLQEQQASSQQMHSQQQMQHKFLSASRRLETNQRQAATFNTEPAVAYQPHTHGAVHIGKTHSGDNPKMHMHRTKPIQLRTETVSSPSSGRYRKWHPPPPSTSDQDHSHHVPTDGQLGSPTYNSGVFTCNCSMLDQDFDLEDILRDQHAFIGSLEEEEHCKNCTPEGKSCVSKKSRLDFCCKDHLNCWIIDSGCSLHMTGDKALFLPQTMQAIKQSVRFGDGNVLTATHIGCVALDNDNILRNVLYVPDMVVNLISVSHMDKQGYAVHFEDGRATMCRPKDKHGPKLTGKLTKGLYVAKFSPGTYIFQNVPQELSHDGPKASAWREDLVYNMSTWYESPDDAEVQALNAVHLRECRVLNGGDFSAPAGKDGLEEVLFCPQCYTVLMEKGPCECGLISLDTAHRRCGHIPAAEVERMVKQDWSCNWSEVGQC